MPGRIGALAAVLAFACALGIASLAPDGVGASTPDPRRQLLRIRGQRPTSTVQQGRQSRPPPRKRKKKRRGDPPLPPAPPPPPQVCRRSDLTGCVARGNSHINGQINELNRTNLYELAYESHYDNVYNRTTEGVIQRCETKSDCNHGKLCVDGVCKCPVLFRGSDDCTVQTKLKFWWCGGSRLHNRFFKILTNCPVCRRKHYFSHLWIARTNFNDTGPEHGQDIVDMADFSTCAVVGGAGSRAKNGVDIDKHTAVIRCNDAPTKHPYGKIVGRRTTLRVQNQDYAGWNEHKGEFCLPYTLQDHRIDRHPSARRFSGCNGTVVSDYAYAYFKNYWDVYRPRRGAPSTGRKEVQVSAGFGAILFAMHVCGKVSIYNFRQGVGHYYKKPRERSQKRHRFSTRHHWNYEKRCMKILADGHLPGVKVKG